MHSDDVTRWCENARLGLIGQCERGDQCRMMLGLMRCQKAERQRQRAGDAARLAQIISLSDGAADWSAPRPKPCRLTVLLIRIRVAVLRSGFFVRCDRRVIASSITIIE